VLLKVQNRHSLGDIWSTMNNYIIILIQRIIQYNIIRIRSAGDEAKNAVRPKRTKGTSARTDRSGRDRDVKRGLPTRGMEDLCIPDLPGVKSGSDISNVLTLTDHSHNYKREGEEAKSAPPPCGVGRLNEQRSC